MSEIYTISDLAHEFGVSTRSIRYYEDVGLVSPSRKGSTRLYDRRDRIRLMLTLRGKRLGFSLAECKELIDLYDTTASDNNKQLKAVIEKANQKRADLQQQLDDIRAIQDGLNTLEALCNAALLKNESKKRNNKDKALK
jgi:DNA-binding transcriptional MerR regulator